MLNVGVYNREIIFLILKKKYFIVKLIFEYYLANWCVLKINLFIASNQSLGANSMVPFTGKISTVALFRN